MHFLELGLTFPGARIYVSWSSHLHFLEHAFAFALPRACVSFSLHLLETGLSNSLLIAFYTFLTSNFSQSVPLHSRCLKIAGASVDGDWPADNSLTSLINSNQTLIYLHKPKRRVMFKFTKNLMFVFSVGLLLRCMIASCFIPAGFPYFCCSIRSTRVV